MNSGEFRADRQALLPEDGIQWRPADMTATFGAQVRWDQINSQSDLWLPVDCQGEPATTLGRLVEQGRTGPLRLGFGGWRDLLLGCQFLDGDDRLITAGGSTVKNVAGYDLTKFMAGQSGIFGKLLTLTTRVYCKPEQSLLAEFPPQIEILNRLLPSPCRPQWAMISSESLTCGYVGAKATVDYYAAQLPAWQPGRIELSDFIADSRWRMEHWRMPGANTEQSHLETHRHSAPTLTLPRSTARLSSPKSGGGEKSVDLVEKMIAQGGNALSMRAAIPPMRIMEFAAKAGLRNWIADAAFGIVLASVGSPSPAIDAAAAVGGRAWFWNSGEGEKLISFSPSAPEKLILERLKKAFDPHNRLAPLPWS